MSDEEKRDPVIEEAPHPLNTVDLFPLFRVLWDQTPDCDSGADDDTVLKAIQESIDPLKDTVRVMWDPEKSARTDYGSAIGMWRAKPWPPDDEEPSMVHLMDVVVMPPYQKRGFGTKLLEDFLGFAERAGYKTALSRTDPVNVPSNRLHRAIGFSVKKEIPGSLIWSLDL